MSKYILSNKVGERRDLQSISVSTFLGLDNLNTNNNMPSYHASDMSNYLVKDGALQTRSGWEQVIDLTDKKDTSNSQISGKINNIYSFTFNGVRYTLAHIGTNLYFVSNFDTNDIKQIKLTKVETNITIADRKSSFIYADDRIYMLVGTYAVLKLSDSNTTWNSYNTNLYYNMVEVYDDEDTYIPTTTIGITYSNSGLASRNTYDDINMLSSKRINTINTINSDSENAIKRYDLDNVIATDTLQGQETYQSIGTTKNDSKIKITIYAYNSSTKETETIEAYGLTRYLPQSTSSTTYQAFHYIWKLGGSFPTTELPTEYLNSADCLGTISLDVNGVSVLSFKNAYTPTTEGEDNVKVIYQDKRDNESNKIGNCSISILYGAGNNRNRLFVSGNSDIPQVDFHSSERNRYANNDDVDLTTYQDYTYFSVNDYCNYGTANSAVMGYQIMGDGSLMVLKSSSNNEPTIYFRQGTYSSMTITQGASTQTVNVDIYPLYVGNVGEGALVKNAIYNLNNDIIFISQNGVFGISSTISSSSLSSDYKYAYNRSRLVNNAIRSKLNEDVVSCLYDNRLFMTLSNGDTYVADGRYTYAPSDRVDNEYDYEWFKLKNINADNYFVINNKLYFSNDNGLFLMDLYKESWEDIRYKELSFGSSTCQVVDNRTEFTISNEVKTYIENNKDNLKIAFNSGSSIYGDVVESDATNCLNVIALTYTPTNDENFRNNYYSDANQYYLHITNQDTQSDIYIPIKLEKQTYDEVYSITSDKDLNDYIYNQGYSTIGELLVKIDTQDHFNLEVDSSNNKMYIISKSGTYLNIVNMSSSSSYLIPTLILVVSNGVYSEWWSRKFNCNNSLFNKILRSVSVANDTDLYSKTNFGIKTKDFEKNYAAQVIGGTNGLQDTYRNLFKADLTKGIFSTSFTKDFNIKFNYIQFCFFNEIGENSIISNMTALYTFGFKIKGVE